MMVRAEREKAKEEIRSRKRKLAKLSWRSRMQLRREAAHHARELSAAFAECRRLEKSAREQQEFLRNVIDSVPGFVCVKGLGGRFDLANRVLAVAYGTTPDQLEGKTDGDFNAVPEEVACFANDDRDVIMERRVKQIPAEKFTNAAGEERWLQTTKVPLIKKDGSCTQLLAVAIDITERRRLEQELFQAYKLQAIGQLAGGVAHDFNNMLAGILGASEIVEKGLPPEAESLREHCLVIQEAAQQAATLVRHLLAFARKQPENVSTVDVHDVIARVIELLKHTLDRRISIQRSLSPAPMMTVCDPVLLQNAILNLAVNARDAMPDGGTLGLSTTRVYFEESDCKDPAWDVSPGPYIEIGVVDTGVGMDEAIQARMFEPFFTTKSPYGGTGLGLPAVYGTVQSHKGKLLVYSEPGRGTLFKLYFPEASGAAQVKEVLSEREIIRGAGRILLIDDEPLVRAVAHRMLVDLGYEVVEVENGYAGALVFADAPQSFDLVILDLIMPKLGGVATFERLRSIRPDLKVLLASGFSGEGEVEALLRAGAIGFLSKPYRMAALSQAVAAAMSA